VGRAYVQPVLTRGGRWTTAAVSRYRQLVAQCFKARPSTSVVTVSVSRDLRTRHQKSLGRPRVELLNCDRYPTSWMAVQHEHGFTSAAVLGIWIKTVLPAGLATLG
jgi:hypothetical protein